MPFPFCAIIIVRFTISKISLRPFVPNPLPTIFSETIFESINNLGSEHNEQPIEFHLCLLLSTAHLLTDHLLNSYSFFNKSFSISGVISSPFLL